MGKKVWKGIAKKYDPDGDKDYKYVQSVIIKKNTGLKLQGCFICIGWQK